MPIYSILIDDYVQNPPKQIKTTRSIPYVRSITYLFHRSDRSSYNQYFKMGPRSMHASVWGQTDRKLNRNLETRSHHIFIATEVDPGGTTS